MLEAGLSPTGSTVMRFGHLTLIWVSEADYSVRRHLSINHARMTFEQLVKPY